MGNHSASISASVTHIAVNWLVLEQRELLISFFLSTGDVPKPSKHWPSSQAPCSLDTGAEKPYWLLTEYAEDPFCLM